MCKNQNQNSLLRFSQFWLEKYEQLSADWFDRRCNEKLLNENTSPIDHSVNILKIFSSYIFINIIYTPRSQETNKNNYLKY
jgi:hypothetical protein